MFAGQKCFERVEDTFVGRGIDAMDLPLERSEHRFQNAA